MEGLHGAPLSMKEKVMPKMSKPFNSGAARMRTLIPDGVYQAVIVATDIRIEGDAGDEETLVGQFLITLGEEKRSVVEWFRINNPSKAISEIAAKALVQLLDAVGIEELSDTDELIGKQLAVRVTTQTSANYPPRNRYAYLPAAAVTA